MMTCNAVDLYLHCCCLSVYVCICIYICVLINMSVIPMQLTALGGRLGGWDSRDHDIFVRVWTQHVAPVAGGSGGKQQSQSQSQREKEGRGVLDLGSKTAYLLRRRLVQAVQMKSEEEIEEHLLW